MGFFGGDRKTAAVFLWVTLFFLLSGLALYLVFSTPPDPPRRSYPVLAEVEERAGSINSKDDYKTGKGDDRIDYSSQGYRAGR
jgi:hypothetical protein